MNGCTTLILVPSPGRDLEGTALVGYHLETIYGHTVAYCGWENLAEEILKRAPAALVLDRPRVPEVLLAARIGTGVAILPTVGYFQDPELFLRRWIVDREDVARAIDCYLTWEDESRAVLLKNGLIRDDVVRTVGCTRFDLSCSQYLPLIEPKESCLRRIGFGYPERPLIVWGTATYFRRTRDHAKKSIPQPDRLELEDEATIYQTISKCIVSLAARHPEWNFLIKVHPSEVCDPYELLTTGLMNIKVAYDVPLRTILHHCDVLVQRGSTTATEAWILGKPVIEATLGKYNVQIKDEMLRGNDQTTTIAEMEGIITRYAQKEAIPDVQLRAREKFLRNTYYRLDGKASERSAQCIEELICRHRRSEGVERRCDADAETQIRVDECDRRLTNRLKDALGLDRDRSLRFWSGAQSSIRRASLCDRPITRNMIELEYERFAAALGRDSAFTARDSKWVAESYAN
jgi:hypothetical protein